MIDWAFIGTYGPHLVRACWITITVSAISLVLATALGLGIALLRMSRTPNAWLLEWPVRPVAIWAGLFPDAPAPQAGRLPVPQAPGWGLRPALG